MLAVVELPAVLEDAVIAVHALVLLGAESGREDVEHQAVDAVLLGERRRVVRGPGGVAVGAHDEHAVDLDVVAVQGRDRVGDVLDRLRLVVAVQGHLVDRLEAELETMAAGAPHETEELLVTGHVGAHLGLPPRGEAAVDHHAKELLQAPLVGGEVVVVEEDRARPLRLQLGDDALGTARPVGSPEHHRHGAERAVEGAPEAGDHGRLAHALRADDQREVGHRQGVEVGGPLSQLVVHRAPVAPVGQPADALQLALARERLDQLQHEALAAFAARHVVGVRQGVLGHEGRVRAADDHRQTGGPEVVGQGVGRRRGGRRRRDADEVGLGEVDSVDRSRLGAVDAHVVAGGFEGRADEGQAEPRVERVGEDVDAGRRRLDEADLQCGSFRGRGSTDARTAGRTRSRGNPEFSQTRCAGLPLPARAADSPLAHSVRHGGLVAV